MVEQFTRKFRKIQFWLYLYSIQFSPMKIISIPRSIFDHKQSYLFFDGRVDIVGAILLNNGYEIPDKTKLPSELRLEIPHFTRIIRRKVVDSALSQKLLTLNPHPQETAIKMANDLLSGIYHLEIIER